MADPLGAECFDGCSGRENRHIHSEWNVCIAKWWVWMQVMGVRSMGEGGVRATLGEEKIRLFPGSDSTMNDGDHLRATMRGNYEVRNAEIQIHSIKFSRG